jgi:hypothetical protein
VTIANDYVNPTTVEFPYTGSVQKFVVPAGVYELLIEAWGSGSGDSTYVASGGYAARFLPVTPGETIYIFVGGSDGYNGGGSSGTVNAGGGASDVRRGGSLLANRVLIAGGAGGPAQTQVG